MLFSIEKIHIYGSMTTLNIKGQNERKYNFLVLTGIQSHNIPRNEEKMVKSCLLDKLTNTFQQKIHFLLQNTGWLWRQHGTYNVDGKKQKSQRSAYLCTEKKKLQPQPAVTTGITNNTNSVLLIYYPVFDRPWRPHLFLQMQYILTQLVWLL